MRDEQLFYHIKHYTSVHCGLTVVIKIVFLSNLISIGVNRAEGNVPFLYNTVFQREEGTSESESEQKLANNFGTDKCKVVFMQNN